MTIASVLAGCSTGEAESALPAQEIVVPAKGVKKKTDSVGTGPSPASNSVGDVPVSSSAQSSTEEAEQAQGVEVKASLNILQRHLTDSDPGADWHITPVCTDLPGWSFYKGIRKDLRNGKLFRWAVQDGVGVLDGDAEELLPMVYGSLKPEDPSGHSVAVLALAGVCLLNNGGGLLNGKKAMALQRVYEGQPLYGPKVTRTDGSTEVDFLTLNASEIRRFVINIDADYAVTYTTEAYAANKRAR